QFATIRTEVRPIPPASVGVTFVVREGPKVKVGRIKFEGNKNVKSRELRHAMHFMRPIGVPHSIFLENIFAKTYDATKLDEGMENLKTCYSSCGYINFTSIPTLSFDEPKKQVSFDIDVDEGKQFSVRRIEFSGNTTTRDKLIRRELVLEEGQLYNEQYWKLSI